MALAMTPVILTANDDMDIDIDMDVEDTMPMVEDEIIEEGERSSFQHQGTSDTSGIIPAIYTEDPALEPQWQKVHLTGLDDFKEAEVRAFSREHFPDGEPYVEWINDTSCNLVFKHKDVARQALLSYLQTPIDSETIIDNPLELRSAKVFSERPASILTVRVAKAGDRKKKGAYLESRFYLMNPDMDPSTRIERDGRSSRGGRGGANGDYRKRRYDDREDRKRRDHDHSAQSDNFTASMYDDAPAANDDGVSSKRGRDLSSRISRNRRRSASPGAISLPSSDDEGRLHDRGPKRRNGYRNRESPPPYARRDPNPYPKKNEGKELFSDPSSANGLRSDAMDIVSSSGQQSQRNQSASADQKTTNKAAANRLKADLMASAGQQSPRNGHRRSRAMDSRNEEDLVERFARKSLSQDSTKSINAKTANSGIELFPTGGGSSNRANDNNGLTIKGGAGFSFKGRAGSEAVKELFPEQYRSGVGGSNKGKELFDEPVRQRNTRQRAGDLFD